MTARVGLRAGTPWHSQWLKLLALVFSGVLAALAVCWPTTQETTQGQPVWWLQLVVMVVPACFCFGSASPRRAFLAGYVFSISWLCSTFWWLYVAMHTYGGLDGVLAGAGVAFLAVALSAYYAAAFFVLRRYLRIESWLAPLVFAAVWTMAELARATWLTGFGWGMMGLAHTDGPLRVLAPVVGVYGIGFVAIWISASAGQALLLGRWLRVLPAMAVVVLLAITPEADYTVSTGSIPVELLQGNIPQDEKFESGTGVPLALAWYADQWMSDAQVLFVAPETAIPLLPMELPPLYWRDLQTRFADGRAALLTGIPLGDDQHGYRNAVIGMGGTEAPGYVYSKHHLVPFGEFIPPLFKWFTRMMNIPLGDFDRGGLGQASFAWHGQRLAPNICYEDLYGEELARRFLSVEDAPTIMVNVSNLGWFGDTIAIDQHLQISRMRALEFQRPFLRATNTGSTQIMDYRGETLRALPRLTRGVLRGEVEGRSGITPYAWWLAQFGLWPVWGLMLALLGVGVYRTRRRAP